MNYQYQPDDYEPQVGDVVVWTDLPDNHENRTKNIPYLVKDLDCYYNSVIILDDNGELISYGSGHGRKTIITKPGSQVKPGNTVMCIKFAGPTVKIGGIYKAVRGPYSESLYLEHTVNYGYKYTKDSFVVLCTEPKTQPKESQECELVTPAKPKPNKIKEQPMPTLNLQFLLEMMTQQPTDATNAQHIGILTEPDGAYVGYVYADTSDELDDVMRKPENESRKLHIFNYDRTIAQKPRKIVSVERV